MNVGDLSPCRVGRLIHISVEDVRLRVSYIDTARMFDSSMRLMTCGKEQTRVSQAIYEAINFEELTRSLQDLAGSPEAFPEEVCSQV